MWIFEKMQDGKFLSTSKVLESFSHFTNRPPSSSALSQSTAEFRTSRLRFISIYRVVKKENPYFIGWARLLGKPFPHCYRIQSHRIVIPLKLFQKHISQHGQCYNKMPFQIEWEQPFTAPPLLNNEQHSNNASSFVSCHLIAWRVTSILLKSTLKVAGSNCLLTLEGEFVTCQLWWQLVPLNKIKQAQAAPAHQV